MRRSSKKLRKMLAALLVCVMAVSVAGFAAAVSPTPEAGDKTGSITVLPQSNSSTVDGGTFKLYYVASAIAGTSFRYELYGAFSAADLDINAEIRTAEQAAEAAQTLQGYISEVDEEGEDLVYSLDRTVDGDTVENLPIGIYLVIQTGVPAASSGSYTAAAPFLVFVPSARWEPGEQGERIFVEWIYDVTAHPKMGYVPPYVPPPGPGGQSSFTVIKAWNDAGFESSRPASIEVTLYRNGAAYTAPGVTNPVTLSAGASWQHTWTNLPTGGGWSVEETEVPEGYFSTSTTMDNITTITNTREEFPPLAATVNVRKTWVGDAESSRPDSIRVTLYRDGTEYDEVSLTAADGWTHTWTGLETGHVWNVAEANVPAGYEAEVSSLPNGFEVTNTWRETTGGGDGGTDLGEPPIPLNPAPQTGMVQWPIPVLAVSGAMLIALGLLSGRGKKRPSKG